MPVPQTATVGMRAASAPLCAQESMPRAMPLIISSRRTARSRASISAMPDAIRRRMPRAHNRNSRPAQQTGRAAHPQHRRRIVDLLEPLRILRATIGDQRRALRRHPRPLLFGRLARLAVEDELRRLGGKPQPFQRGQRQLKNLARRLQLLHRVQNPLRTQTRRQHQRQPGQPLLIQRGADGIVTAWGIVVI